MHQSARDRRDRAIRLLDDRKETYAQFMAAAAMYGNRMAETSDTQFGLPGNGDAVQQALERENEAHQALMVPLFRLRMIGHPEVRTAGENVLNGLHRMRVEYRKTEKDQELIDETWQSARDSFLEAARRGLDST